MTTPASSAAALPVGLTVDDYLRLLLAALLGAAFAFLLASMKAARDEQRDLCDRLGEAILAAADLGAEYWLAAGNDDGIALLEARLMGAQAYLARYRIIALTWLAPKDRWAVEDSLAELYDSLTGGQFKVKDRPADPQRAEACQVQAALTAVLVRQGNLSSLKVGAQIVRSAGWHWAHRAFHRMFQWREPRA